MSFLTTKELEELREDANTLLGQTCNIVRPGWSTDDMGGYDPDAGLGTVATSVKCRLEPREYVQPEVKIFGEQQHLRDLYNFYVPYDTDIRAGDQVQIGTVIYEVFTEHDKHTERALNILMVAEVEN